MQVVYHPIFQGMYIWAGPLILSDLAFEGVAVMHNLASLYSQLAKSQNLNSVNGRRWAIRYYQVSAAFLPFGHYLTPRSSYLLARYPT